MCLVVVARSEDDPFEGLFSMNEDCESIKKKHPERNIVCADSKGNSTTSVINKAEASLNMIS
jgi:hypothetical protein